MAEVLLQESPRVLCVDDEQGMLDAYQHILQSEAGIRAADNELMNLEAGLFGENTPRLPLKSFDLTLCRQGDEAMHVCRQALDEKRPFSVVFLDMRMPPGPTGVETGEQIRMMDPDTEIVVVTAYSDTAPSDIVQRVKPEKQLYYLQKPVHHFEVWQLASALSGKWSFSKQVREAHVLLEHTNGLLRLDIVERRRIERELANRKRELEGLIYTLSHDLTSPLVSMSGFLRILHEEGHINILDDAGRDCLFRIQANLDTLKMMLTSVIELSDAMRIANDTGKVMVANTVIEALDRLTEQVDSSNAQVMIEPSLPTVFFSKEGLIQVFCQLIENGIKFAHEGTTPRISVGYSEMEGYYRFWVKDEGIGFPDAFKQRIFDAFVRLHHDHGKGAGVGLAIVRRLIEDSGGQVGAESIPGEGSTFWFTIPKQN
jgi:signal transduction histidine kinase